MEFAKTSFFNVIFFSWLLSGLPVKSIAQDSKYKRTIERFKKMEYDWLIAEFKQDTATIAALMDSNFLSIGPDGVGTKQQELSGIYNNIGQRIKNKHVVDSLNLEDFRVKIYGNTAVVTFISVTKGRIQNIPFDNRRTRMYDVWINQKGKWKAVSSQVTPLQQP